MLYIRDIINKKRNKETLTEEELEFFIQGYFKEEISEAQAAALMTAIHIYGLSEKEVTYIANSIAQTGEELEFYRISNKITSINSIGGISDKIILILLSIINALGLPAAKVIGRELGMEDRLLSIPNYKLEDNIDNFKKTLQDEKLGILKSISNLAPIENKLYKLRREIACDSDINLIAISIMSQQIALGFTNIFFEITYGKNAYVKTEVEAKELAKYLVTIGKRLMRNVSVAVTKLDEPVGKCFGNLIEMKEVYDALSGSMTTDVEDMVLDFGSSILSVSTDVKDRNKNKKKVIEVIKNGKALMSFEKLISIGNGNIELLKKDIVTKNIIPVMSSQAGYINEIDVNEIRMVARYIDAIRTKTDGKLDIGAGIVFNKKAGDKVGKGEILAYLYTNNETKIEKATIDIKNAYKISDKKAKPISKIVFEI